MKTCLRCNKEFPATLEFFYKDPRNKTGLSCYCKICKKKHVREWQVNHPEKRRETSQRWRERNIEKQRKCVREWGYANLDKKRESGRRCMAIPKNRLNGSMRAGIVRSLKDGKNGHSWETLVGYTCDELMTHLETQFTKGMTWDNYGEWHVDHIRPVSDFVLNTFEDSGFKECWSLWNLQPMWEKENQLKSNKCKEPPLPLLK